jgi:endonuclease/exonuclease/phosphatase family metal-dependent hydrolase
MLAHKQITKALRGSLRHLTEQKAWQKFTKHVQASAAACRRSIILLLLLVTELTCQSALRVRADENQNSPALKVMTQNVDAGTDFGYLAGASTTPAFLQGVIFTYEEINASNFAPRAAQLAREIARNRPALVDLQEVALWRTGPLNLSPGSPPSATVTLYDQLKLLLDDLANQYVIVAVQTLMDVEAPVLLGAGFDLRYTDQNAVLVRADLRRQLALSNIQRHLFKDQSIFKTAVGNFPILRGWISADACFLGKPMRFVTTQLETDADPVIQLKQANELVQALKCDLPVALCGDFNADANTPNPTIAAILNGGFTEAWPALHPRDPGFTIPLFIEDLPAPPPFIAVSTPSHRIDLVFVRDLGVSQIDLIGNQVFPPWPSDHAGVTAFLGIERHEGDRKNDFNLGE